ncbi:MAG: energy transducer TonB [Ignavibacteria bacterium]|jgi:protein TonB
MKKQYLVLPLLLPIFLTITLTASNGNENEVKYLPFAEKMPEVEGGLASIAKNVKYPEVAQKAGVQGKVFVLAFVDEDGTVNDAKVVRGIGAGCDEAAIEAIKKCKFTPGMHEGKKVKVKIAIPIEFKMK